MRVLPFEIPRDHDPSLRFFKIEYLAEFVRPLPTDTITACGENQVQRRKRLFSGNINFAVQLWPSISLSLNGVVLISIESYKWRVPCNYQG